MKQGEKNKTLRSLLIILISAVFSLTMMACGGDKKKQTASTPITNNDNDRDRNDESYWTSALGESMNGSVDSAQLALDFYSDGNGSNISAKGELYISRFDGFGLCDLPEGTYDIETETEGHQNFSGLIKGLQLESTSGPVDLKMSVISFSLLSSHSRLESCSGDDYAQELLGQVYIIEVDGDDCGNKPLSFLGNTNNVNCD